MIFILSIINIIIILIMMILIYRTPQIEYKSILFALMVLQLALIIIAFSLNQHI